MSKEELCFGLNWSVHKEKLEYINVRKHYLWKTFVAGNEINGII